MAQLRIIILLGTGRVGRQSEQVAKFVLAEARSFGFDAEIYDVRDYGSAVTIPPGAENKAAEKWKNIVEKTQGIIIVMPEYNHSYPGELKILLDPLKEEYIGKPVALCPVSAGNFGGARAAEHILPVLNYLQLRVVPGTVYFSSVAVIFNEAGKTETEKYKDKLKILFMNLKTSISVKN